MTHEIGKNTEDSHNVVLTTVTSPDRLMAGKTEGRNAHRGSKIVQRDNSKEHG